MRLTVIHWLPLEQFPPAYNLLHYFARNPRLRVTCGTSVRENEPHPFVTAGVDIFRAAFPAASRFRMRRILQFIRLNWLLLRTLLLSRPQAVLYFEPHSATAVFLYLFFHRSVRLFIHYHEYRELSHYKDQGNAIARLGHWLERRWLFQRCEWISHTNSDRVRMFLEDHPEVPQRLMRAMPNYPPPEWLNVTHPRTERPSPALRLVYVGAVSLQTTFIRELVEWVTSVGETYVTLDIYAGNTDQATQTFLKGLGSTSVRFFPNGVHYDQLPETLVEYDAGVILYRGTTRNYIYNAPNKLFEYLICGLDVWYPRQMHGIRPVAQQLSLQQAIEVDFERPRTLDAILQMPRRARSREWHQTSAHSLRPLLEALSGIAECD